MIFRKNTLTSLVPATLGLLFLFLAACNSKKADKSEQTAAAEEPPIIIPDDEIHAQYAGSDTCKECHEAAFKGWEHSNHGLAEREVRKDMDEKAFSPKQTLKHGTETSETFLDADGVAQILTLGLGNKRRNYPVVRIIGNDPLRQFLVPAPGNRLQTVDVSYDPHKNDLFDVYGEEIRNPGDWGAWTGQGMNWNATCAACHNTRLRKNYDPTTDTYHTAMAEMSVGCEACHGPMKAHMEWQKKPPLAYGKDKGKTKDPTATKFSRDQMSDTCAACHARRGEISGDLIPGESFYDHFSLTVTDGTDTYHPDGQVRDEDYEYASLISSKMYHAGVRCVDCHDPHSGKRLVQGNMLCMRCHESGAAANGLAPAPIIDPTAHSHHAEGSTGNDCTSCHMPVTTYMQRHPRHDHGFTIPDPLLTKQFGTPNACNRCHTDKDADWALKASEEWYGEKLDRPTRARAQLVGRARQGDPAARQGLIDLLKTEPIAAWQATACHLLERWVMDGEATQALLGQLTNTSPLVREAAVRTLTPQTRANNLPVRAAIKPLQDDSVRSVRVAAAWALVDTLDLKSKAGKELVHMLDLGSDQPIGRMQLSQFAFLRGNTATAIRQIRKAIASDPLSPAFHHDLAILLSMTGDTAAAIKALEDAARLAPEDPEYPYKLALAWGEAGDLSKSILYFEKSLALDPQNARAWYNLGLVRNSLNQPQEAIAALLRGEAADSSDPGIPYALATIYARLGRRDNAIGAATRALQIRQNFPEAIQLLRSLSR